MSVRVARRGAAAMLCVFATSACEHPAAAPAPTPSSVRTGSPLPDPRGDLAARAAAALDRREVAVYQWTPPGGATRSVVLTRAVDGGWRADIAKAALGGSADIAIARTKEGAYHCALASADRLITPRCARVGGTQAGINSDIDPRVQHVFVDWLEIFTDRDTAIAVSAVPPPRGLRGDCFAAQANAASLPAPIEAGTYCYDDGGLLVGARLGLGALTLVGSPSEAPPTISLPGPVTDDRPLPLRRPPTPSPSDDS
ncbi:hypothetical protein [Pilimelia columellifera]|uniref:Lipoprotein n=1 Tax=Pilimelia columellifera subsp. columellifera TaxID=706583 RepID=A0ABP6AM59_9ACTN